MARLLVTGGAGFIGSCFTSDSLQRGNEVVVLDALTYAGHLENLSTCSHNPRFTFVHGDIRDFDLVRKVIGEGKFDFVVNFAAESHVDNSIQGPLAFVETNVLGTFNLLEASRFYWNDLNSEAKQKFRFLQVSTDEVFGSLGPEGYFSETTSYAPNSPYSASKASGDHFVRSWHETYGLPTLLTNCSNNYGPRQFPEKLIPLMINNALRGMPLPVYGDGKNVRDWIHVEDHCRGIGLALERGTPGNTYCFGGASERTNLQVVGAICDLLEELRPRSAGSYRDLVQFVADRPGHDRRYAIDDNKARRELGFVRAFEQFEEGLRQTVTWYLNNTNWINAVVRNKNEGNPSRGGRRDSPLPVNKVHR